jgi:hypothetical protein
LGIGEAADKSEQVTDNSDQEPFFPHCFEASIFGGRIKLPIFTGQLLTRQKRRILLRSVSPISNSSIVQGV